MSIHYVGGTVFGTRSGALMLQGGKTAAEALQSPADYASPLPGTDEVLGDIAMHGTNNLLPQEHNADIDITPVLSAAIDAKARIMLGKGPTPARITGFDADGNEVLQFLTERTIPVFLEAHRAFENSFALAKDLMGYGSAYVQILLSRDRKKIVGYKRMDTTKCRLSKVDENTGKSEFVYISADWMRWNRKDANDDNKHIAKIPLLDKDYPLEDLQSRTEGYIFAMCIQYPLTNKNYYPTAPWYCARKWVKIAQSIPEMKEAMFKNQITLKYIVEIHPKFWKAYDPTYETVDKKGKKAIQDRFYQQVDEYLVGGDNQYKSLFSTTVEEITNSGVTSVPGIKITPVADPTKDGKFAPDSAAANSEILFAQMINPAIMGADSPGGPYSGGAGSGSNIREAVLLLVVLCEIERRLVSQPLMLMIKYNGLGDDVVIRYPQQILTTLNTGANTQTVA